MTHRFVYVMDFCICAWKYLDIAYTFEVTCFRLFILFQQRCFYTNWNWPEIVSRCCRGNWLSFTSIFFVMFHVREAFVQLRQVLFVLQLRLALALPVFLGVRLWSDRGGHYHFGSCVRAILGVMGRGMNGKLSGGSLWGKLARTHLSVHGLQRGNYMNTIGI